MLNTPNSSIRFGQSVDLGIGKNKAFPFVYSFVRPENDGAFYTGSDEFLGVTVQAGMSRTLPIILDPDYNFMFDFARYQAMTADSIHRWYNNSFVDYPVTITAGVNDDIDFEEDSGVPLVATVAAGTYTPLELCDAIKVALDAAGASTYTVVYSQVSVNNPNSTFSGLRYEISSGLSGAGNIFSLLWATGANVATSIGPTLGYAVADGTGASFYLASTAQNYSQWSVNPFDYQLSYGKRFVDDIRVRLYVPSSQGNTIYGGEPASLNTQNVTADGYNPLQPSLLQGYDYGVSSLKTPYFTSMSGDISIKIYNTNPTEDLIISGGLLGYKVRI